MTPENMRRLLKPYKIHDIAGQVGVAPATLYRFRNGAPISFESQALLRDFFARQAEEHAKAAGDGDD